MKLSLVLLFALAQSLYADEVGPDFDPENVESWEVDYGYYPYRTYQSFDLISPQVRTVTHEPECDDGLFTFLTPRGWSISEPGPRILDNKGDLVWAKDTPGQAYDLVVQDFQGQKYLSYWIGDDRVRGHGAGDYYMLNSSYHQVHKISAFGNLAADLHEMVITPEGTALITVYEIYPKDVTEFREFTVNDTDPNYIWDCLFQEIDIAKNELIFEWRASDHHALNESYHDIGDAGTKENPWDFYHINSVQKDSLGNYIVSARFPHVVSYVHGGTGEILWRLGGKLNDFKDLSDGEATNFSWQHDARFHTLAQFPEIMSEAIAKKGRSDNGLTTRLVTLFDNAAEDGHRTRDISRGLLLEVNYPSPDLSSSLKPREATSGQSDRYTVRLVKSYENPAKIISSSQGSLQVVPSAQQGKDPKVLVGYGYNAVWTEYAANGKVLCDTHFASNFSWERGDVQSYRTMKFPWIGKPTDPPSAVLADDGDAVYVSWNGATEVRHWILQHSDSSAGGEDEWTDLIRVEKQGFESELEFDEDTAQRYLRVKALDVNGHVLGISKSLDIGWSSIFAQAIPSFSSSSATPLKLLMLFVFNVTAMFILYELYRRFCSWNRSRRWSKARRGVYLLSPTLSSDE